MGYSLGASVGLRVTFKEGLEALDPLNLRTWFRDYPWLPSGEQTIEVRPEARTVVRPAARTVVLTSQEADLTGKMCKDWLGRC